MTSTERLLSRMKAPGDSHAVKCVSTAVASLGLEKVTCLAAEAARYVLQAGREGKKWAKMEPTSTTVYARFVWLLGEHKS